MYQCDKCNTIIKLKPLAMKVRGKIIKVCLPCADRLAEKMFVSKTTKGG